MTREQAITRYNAIKARGDFCEYLNEEMVDMAIQALSQEPCGESINKTYEFGKNRGVAVYWNKQTDTVELPEAVFRYILALVPTEEAEQEPCDDAISREDAIRKLRADTLFVCTGDKMQAISDIEGLPPVTQKSGKWIEDAKTYYEELNKRGLGVDEYTPYFTDDIACSVCLAKYNTIDNETQFFKHCPNCGARMESEDKE